MSFPKEPDAKHQDLWKGTGSALIPLLEFTEMNVQARYWINPNKKVLEILHAKSKSKQDS